MEIFDKYSVSLKSVLSISGLALKIFRSNFLNKENISIVRGRAYNIIREAYYGGRVDVFVPFSDKTLYYYDVNSLYPMAMLNDMPVGRPTFISNVESLSDFFGFCRCTVKAPKDLKIPVLPYKVEGGGNINPLGTWKGWYFSEELKLAEEFGYQISLHEGYSFERDNSLFKEYVNTLYNSKILETGIKRIISKLLMNSLYGKFGMSETHPMISIVNKEEFEAILQKYNILDCIELPSGNLIIKYENVVQGSLMIDDTNKIGSTFIEGRKFFLENNQSIAIAAAIASYSRIYMNRAFKDQKVFYTDTDSIVIDRPLNEEMVSENKLGKFKLEHVVQRAYFIAPKLYLLETGDKTIIKSRGIQSSLLNKEDFVDLFNDKPITKSTEKWYKSLGRSTVFIKDLDLTLTPSFNKRVKLYENGVWFDTDPYIVEGDIIVNRANNIRGARFHSLN